MKKILFVLIATILINFANAQEVHFMPRVGVNISNVSNTGTNWKPGVNVGLSVEMPVLEKLSIEPGLYYSMQGMKINDYFVVDHNLLGANVNWNFDYLNIPIYAKYYIYEGFNVFAGPQFGFNVRTKMQMKAAGYEDGVTDFKGSLNTFEFGLGFGAGYQFDMGLNVSFNYNLGLTDIIKEHDFIEWEFDDSEKYRNRVFQFNVGYRF